jgi:hypothetical protein
MQCGERRERRKGVGRGVVEKGLNFRKELLE